MAARNRLVCSLQRFTRLWKTRAGESFFDQDHPMIDHSVAGPHVHPSLRGFSTIELESMRRDGDIQRHGIAGYEFYLPIGTVPTAVDRAASLLPLWRPGRVFIEATARWIIRGGTPPEQIVIARNSTRRLPPVERVRWLNRRIPVKDRLQVGGVELWMPNAPQLTGRN